MIKIKKSYKLLKFIKNKNPINTYRFGRRLLLAVFLFFSLFHVVFAQVLPARDRDVKVSATIPDTIPPSAPILINPEDETNLDMTYPVFQWYESTDDKGMSHYQFILNGRIWFDNIPLTSFVNEHYSLHYDSTFGIYTLVARAPLPHGRHHWRIIAFDHGNNQTTSTTWFFNILVKNPNFRLQKIGDVNVNIRANDPSSVPLAPINLFVNEPFANEPWLIALGDANLKVDLLVSIPNRDSLHYSQYTDAQGNWSLQLGILPRNQAVRLDFTIVDAVGNTSYIFGLYIMVLQHYWPPSPTPYPTIAPTGTPTTIPTIAPTGTPTTVPTTTSKPGVSATPPPVLTVSPTLAPPSTSGIPTSSRIPVAISPTTILPVTPTPPASGTPVPVLTLHPSLAPPGIRVPIIPPKEIVHEAIEEIKKSLPDRVAVILTDFAAIPLMKALVNYFALILALLLPLITYMLVLSKFLKYWSIKILRKVLIALWPWSKKRKHLVFEYRNSQAAPLVRIELLDAETKEVIDWQVTSYLGQFYSFDWPDDRPLVLKVKDYNFYFPIGGNKPLYLSWHNFYQGETFLTKNQITNQQAENFNPKRALAIPTLLAQGKNNLPLIERLRIFLSYLLTYPWWFWFLSLLPIALFAIRYPSLFNYLALFYYLAIALCKYLYKTGVYNWQFKVLFSNGSKINQNLILVINDLERGFSQASVIAMSDGMSPKLALLKNDFIFSLQVRDYALWDGQRVLSGVEYSLARAKLSEFKLHAVESSNHNLRTLQPHCQLLPRQSQAH